MNQVTIQVDKIRSYQTLVYKNGNNSFKKKEYKEYQRVMSLQMAKLSPVRANKPVRVQIHFRCKNRVVGDIDNITKPVLDTLQLCGKLPNDKQVEHLEVKKTFKHKNNAIEIVLKELSNV